MTDEPIRTSHAPPAAVAAAPPAAAASKAPLGTPPSDLHCPECEYALIELEEHGIRQCPECGAALDFDLLRRWRLYGQQLGTPRQIVRQVLLHPRQFFNSIKAPRYYLRSAGIMSPMLLGTVALTGFSAVGALLTAVMWALGENVWHTATLHATLLQLLTIYPLSCVFIIMLLGSLTQAWTWLLLGLAGCERSSTTAQQISFFAGAAAVPMAAAVILQMVSLGLIAAFPASHIGGHPTSVAIVILWINLLCFSLTAAIVVYWSWLMTLGFRAFTRQSDSMLWPLVFFNPGLVLVLLTLYGVFMAIKAWWYSF